jgi:hypothetical protein
VLRLARPSGISASVSDAQVNLMGLSPVPVRPAPGFTLTDQDGRTLSLSLSLLRCKVVVLKSMDPHWTNICPIVSHEYVDACRDLGPPAGQVVFAAVIVNQYHAAVSDMMANSREQRLITIPGWHFFTGPVSGLRKVWDGQASRCRRPAGTPTSCTPPPSTSSTRPAGSGSSPPPWPTTHLPVPPTSPQGRSPPGGRASPRSPESWPGDHAGTGPLAGGTTRRPVPQGRAGSYY